MRTVVRQGFRWVNFQPAGWVNFTPALTHGLARLSCFVAFCLATERVHNTMKRLAYMGLMALLVGCSSIYRTAPVSPEDQAAQTRVAGIPIKHVIIIIQENRTPDNLFRGLPGADTIPPRFMHKIGLVTPYDLPHSHRAFERN